MNSNMSESQVCPACGTKRTQGAFQCPSCKQTYCAACQRPVVLDRTTTKCNYSECELFTKPICENCMKVEICSGQWLDKELVTAATTTEARKLLIVRWCQKYFERQTSSWIEILVLVGALITLLSVVVAVVRWSNSPNSKGISGFLDFFGMPLFFAAGLGMFIHAQLEPKVSVKCLCPKCLTILGFGVPIQRYPDRKMSLNKVGRMYDRITGFMGRD